MSVTFACLKAWSTLLDYYTDITGCALSFQYFLKKMSKQLLIYFILIKKIGLLIFLMRNWVKLAVSFCFLYLQPLKIEYFDFKAATGDQWINA